MAGDDDGFLSRWSRRKVQARQEAPPEAVPARPAEPAPATVAETPPAPVEAPAPPAPPPPTLEEARALTPESEFARFVKPDVAPEVRHTALKQLFTDPHFNRMDGLDVYIDDYGRPDPLPESMLRQMTQAAFLNLFADEPAPPAPAAPPPTPALTPAPDEDPDLRLQPHDAAGPPDPGPGAGEDAGREP